MSDSSRTDDSAPSLSSYPPAFVTLITTFIKRAEEAETRAHKALVILRAKDEQVLQLQERTEVLEKIATRLEEVMVPPLDLPKSPQSEDLDACHPRNSQMQKERNIFEYPPLETLYERYPTVHQRKRDGGAEVHNCYTRCQHLIDGLERSNCQLREALAAESKQRVRDHEEYLTTLARLTCAVQQWQTDNSGNGTLAAHSQNERNNVTKSVSQEGTTTSGAGDVESIPQSKDISKLVVPCSENYISFLDEDDIQDKLQMAEKIILSLRKRLEKRGSALQKRPRLKLSKSAIHIHKLGRSSSSSYHTPLSTTSNKTKKCQTYYFFLTALKRKNQRLKMKYDHVYERFKESLNLCGQLQEDLISVTENRKIAVKCVEVVEESTQTDKVSKVSDQRCRLLQGRLHAAAKVMAAQSKQLQDLQQQLQHAQAHIETLRKRLSRAETALATKEALGDHARSQLHGIDAKHTSLNEELQQFKEKVEKLNKELFSQRETSTKLEKEKDNCEQKMDEMKRAMESKVMALAHALREQDELTERSTCQLEAKLGSLRQQFVSQLGEARDRLLAADNKIQELYLGMEIFLKLLFGLCRSEVSTSSGSEVTSVSRARAVQVASDILQLAPDQVHTFLNSARLDSRQVNKWIKECNQLVHNKVFAKDLGHFLLEATLDARLY